MFYTLMDKTWVFNQSEPVQGPVYMNIIIQYGTGLCVKY